MSQQPDARQLIQAAEEAAVAGDLASADDLLRAAARIQEDQLGPVHPDLASTLNNLAIVAEKTGRPDDAEAFYRRAAAIAAASLPADHPMVSDSRQNLEDFCRASGRPIEVPVATTPVPAPAGKPEAGDVPPVVRPAVPVSQPPSAARPLPTTRPASRSRVWVAIAVVVLVSVVVLVTRWSSREPAVSVSPSAPAPIPVLAEPPQRAAAAPPAAPPAVMEAPQPAAPRGGGREAVASPAAGRAPAQVPVTLDTADLCATFSTAGGAWRCEPAGDSVAPGPTAFYTRVKASRDTAIVHRWYRGNALRQSVTLTIRANPAAGYRTYSRQTVDSGADWRVEVRSANGDVLHERRFAVR